ncbi:MAG: uL15m family ribosomal protein [Halobacteriaceae archaeon]
MSDKKDRQRGSRTHGGGTHKNRRGAGNRGGRGRAGRDKHEQALYPDKGKSGFTRPESTQVEVAEVTVRELDEEAPLLAADGLAESDGDGYRIDARDVVEDGHDVDVVKVLGGGQVRHELTIVADAFTDGAISLIEGAGGSAETTESTETDTTTEPDDDS